MSILIKGMKMPTSCLECRLYNDPWCMAKNRNQWRTAYNRPPNGERQNDCPLVPIPPHGRLIDADTLIGKLHDECLFDYEARSVVYADIQDALTIIPAEEGE